MTPFPNLHTAMKFWMQECSRKDAPVGVVVDFRDIGKGLQRREIRRDPRRGWYIGFPDANPGGAAR